LDNDLPYDETEPVMGEVVDDPFVAVRAAALAQHDNIVYLPPIELHTGKYLRVEARICIIYRHDSGDYHHARLEVIYFKRRRQMDGFAVVRKAVLDGAALETLGAGLLQIPRFRTLSIDDTARALLLPVGATAPKLSAVEARSLREGMGNLLSTPQGLDAIRDGRLTSEALRL